MFAHIANITLYVKFLYSKQSLDAPCFHRGLFLKNAFPGYLEHGLDNIGFWRFVDLPKKGLKVDLFV